MFSILTCVSFLHSFRSLWYFLTWERQVGKKLFHISNLPRSLLFGLNFAHVSFALAVKCTLWCVGFTDSESLHARLLWAFHWTLGAMCHLCPIARWINTLPFQVMPQSHWAVRIHKKFDKETR